MRTSHWSVLLHLQPQRHVRYTCVASSAQQHIHEVYAVWWVCRDNFIVVGEIEKGERESERALRRRGKSKRNSLFSDSGIAASATRTAICGMMTKHDTVLFVHTHIYIWMTANCEYIAVGLMHDRDHTTIKRLCGFFNVMLTLRTEFCNYVWQYADCRRIQSQWWLMIDGTMYRAKSGIIKRNPKNVIIFQVWLS